MEWKERGMDFWANGSKGSSSSSPSSPGRREERREELGVRARGRRV